jgi:hypothetical protein
MKKHTLFIGMAVLPTLLFAVSASSQADMVVVNPDAFDNVRRSPAVFRHDAHNERAKIEECNTCHFNKVDFIISLVYSPAGLTSVLYCGSG